MNAHSFNNQLMVKFWGVRGSHPVPGDSTVQFGGNTACVEVRFAGENGPTLIFDAGTGIINLGRHLAGRTRQAGTALAANIFFSHLHHDHTQGFPFFTPAYLPNARLRFFGPDSFQEGLASVLERNQMPPMFPVTLKEMACAKEIHSLQSGDVIELDDQRAAIQRAAIQRALSHPAVDAVLIRVPHSYAHPGGVLIYRIEWRGLAVVYATDTEGYVGIDRRLAHFASGADLLIHDAQYADDHYHGQRAGLPATQGYGHSTASMACELARAAGVKQLVLFHHDPNYSDKEIAAIETQARNLFPATQAAYEGLELVLDCQTGKRLRAALPKTQQMARSEQAG